MPEGPAELIEYSALLKPAPDASHCHNITLRVGGSNVPPGLTSHPEFAMK